MDRITAALKQHYSTTFAEHGATARGVDWGRDADVALRYDKMLAVLETANVDGGEARSRASLLDVGCGYGGLFAHASERQIRLDYTGIDVVCNGILTQKLTTSIREMDVYAQAMIKRMFELCRRGIAFNLMTNKVNFTVENLYYRSPVELLAYCLADITDRVRLDHSYKLYEYTVYLYR
jgi:2-polyprenyl-3-methyl-5-hydroxy-6-metoxy-1,4-benzoquinol methylase